MDYISEVELKLKKVSYKDSNLSLDDFFIKDPTESTLYNIVDVILILGLSNKLQFFGLHNTIRRAMHCTYHESMKGSSALYDAFVFSKLSEQNNKIRYGIISESSISFNTEYLEQFESLKGVFKKKVPTPKVTAKEFSNISKQFPGAYVKKPLPEIITDGTAVIDLDATSMYPSNILQANISFDCYKARVLPPQCYTLINNVLIKSLGTGTYPLGLSTTLSDMIIKYVNAKDKNPKDENISKTYYTMMGLLNILMKSGKTFNELCNPQDTETSILLRNVLIPLTDIMCNIHPTYDNQNQFIYDYLHLVDLNSPNPGDNISLVSQKYPNGIWVAYNPNETNTYIKHVTVEEFYTFKDSNIITLSGCMFTKHAEKKGLFVDMLIDFAALRKHHKKLRDTFTKGTKEYKFEDNNQNVFKRLMNTCYGLYGMAAFRYSDHWLSTSITNNSRYCLKSMMATTEQYLQSINQ